MNSDANSTTDLFAWMAWTPPVAIFFAAIAAVLIMMTICELRFPSATRKGFLPMPTTRGDRLFIGLLVTAYILLAWIGLTDREPWIALIASALALGIVLRWG